MHAEFSMICQHLLEHQHHIDEPIKATGDVMLSMQNVMPTLSMQVCSSKQGSAIAPCYAVIEVP